MHFCFPYFIRENVQQIICIATTRWIIITIWKAILISDIECEWCFYHCATHIPVHSGGSMLHSMMMNLLLNAQIMHQKSAMVASTSAWAAL